MEDIEREQLFRPSTADLLNPPIFFGHDINLVVSVARARDIKPNPLCQPGPIFKARVGEFEFWIVAYRHPEDAVVLEVETREKTDCSAVGNWQRRPPPAF